jgi:hypothetical protein
MGPAMLKAGRTKTFFDSLPLDLADAIAFMLGRAVGESLPAPGTVDVSAHAHTGNSRLGSCSIRAAESPARR